ncbi:MAG: response regulator [Anaerolinea sp.]|nr:response regulator [Anaerolinea sp.]
MPPAATPQSNPTSKTLTARVLRSTPAGLVVALPDGREGLVREREMGWDTEARVGWTKRYTSGMTVQVFPLEKGRKRRPELSIRLAQTNSWLEIRKRYPAGSLVEGVVTGAMAYGVFIELEQGISGLMHTSRFPASARGAPGEIFWPGDRVIVTIDRVDVERKRIALSMENLAAQRWRDAPSSGSPATPVADEPPIGDAGVAHTLDRLIDSPRKSLLVVEDDETQRKSVADWLRFAGQTVEITDSAETALAIVASRQFNIVLMDVGLPGMSGIEAAHRIKEQWPEVGCALMTDWGRAERRAAELQTLRIKGVALLIKPLLPEDLLGILLDETPLQPPTPSPLAPVSVSRSLLERLQPSDETSGRGGLDSILQRLQASTRADKIVLFEMDVEGRRITALAQKGGSFLRAHAIPGLIYSPVRDVAEDGKIVLARNAQQTAERRFAHLRPLLDFEACLGVPAPARLHNSYALFLFFADASCLTDSVSVQAEGAAAAIGAWLERQQMQKQVADFNRIAVLGQLGRALVHEISGRLNPVNLTLQRLQAGCDRVEQCATTSPESVIEEARRAREEMQTLRKQVETLAKTTRSFSRMTRQGQQEIVVLDEIIEEALDILRDTAAAAHVTIVLQPAPRVFFTRIQVTHLQQVMVNVLQNAIQQIHLARPKTGGRIEIRLEQTHHDDKPVVRMCVEDDGSGIHRRLWQRIFEMDYTTRSDGSGLGLYLSRNLIEAEGGRLFVAASHMFWGSTFVIEVPSRL